MTVRRRYFVNDVSTAPRDVYAKCPVAWTTSKREIALPGDDARERCLAWLQTRATLYQCSAGSLSRPVKVRHAFVAASGIRMSGARARVVGSLCFLPRFRMAKLGPPVIGRCM